VLFLKGLFALLTLFCRVISNLALFLKLCSFDPSFQK
jgi:hypothetical protein